MMMRGPRPPLSMPFVLDLFRLQVRDEPARRILRDATLIDCASMKTRLLFVLGAFAIATPSFAQLAAPNSTGAALGHIHINAVDVEAQTRFWTSVGGQIVQREKLTMVQIPGVYILVRKQDPTGGTNGSVLNHFGL